MALSIVPSAFAQPDREEGGYTIARRGPNDRVWVKLDPFQPGVTKSFTEVASGLHYWEGEWREAQDLIELTKDGAAAVYGQCKAYFSGNLNVPGAIRLETASRVHKTRPLGLFYYDTSKRQAIRIAVIEDCSGELLPPNQVVWKAIFGPKPALQADLRITYTKAAIETDFILLESPEPPESFGFDPHTTKLELWHEWEGAPMPSKREVFLNSVDFKDELLDFGDLFFPRGRGFMAYAADSVQLGQPARVQIPDFEDGNSLPVVKEWHVIDGRSILTERVEWRALWAQISQLPKNRGSAQIGDAKERMLCFRELQSSVPDDQNRGKAIELAASPYAPNGFVWDYIIVNGSGHYTFNSYETYWLSGMGYFGGTVTFNSRCAIKYDENATLLLYGNVVCWGTSANPTVLTSEDEDVPKWLGVPGGVGEVLPFSTHVPTYRASPAIWLYWMSYPQTLSGLKIRWAKTAIKVEGYAIHSLTDSSIQVSQTGIYLSQCSAFAVSGSTKCSVLTESAGSTECYSGALIDLCVGQTDSDSDGLPDWWEFKYFGDNSASPTADSDGDCGSNINESIIGTNPIDYPQLTPQGAHQIVRVGDPVTFAASANLGCLTYAWKKQTSVVSTTPTYSIASADLSDSAPYLLEVRSDLFAINALWNLVVCDNYGWNVWESFRTATNGATAAVWNIGTPVHPAGWPDTANPSISRNSSGLLTGRQGVTSIAGCSSFENANAPHGQLQIVALTKRHAIMCGHCAGTRGLRLDSGFAGKKVFFYTADNQTVKMTVHKGYVHADPDPYDYSILLFTEDLPDSILPMRMGYLPYDPFPVVLRTCQHNYVSANQPPSHPNFIVRPPFNDHATCCISGDSGSPWMIPTLDGQLIFVALTSGKWEKEHVQATMDYLCGTIGLNPNDYRISWWDKPY